MTITGGCFAYVIQKDSVVTWMAFKDATKTQVVTLEVVLARVRDGKDRPHALRVAVVPATTTYDVVGTYARAGRACEFMDVAGEVEHAVWADVSGIRVDGICV